MTKNILFVIGAIALLVLGFVLGVYSIGKNNAQVVGGTSYDVSNLVGDVYNGISRVLVLSGGYVVGPVSSTAVAANSLTISGGTAITGRKCATATWNPGSLDPFVSSTVATAVTSTNIALSGAVMGDLCEGSLSSGTSSAASINCFMSGTATATIRLINLGSTALDLATGTAKVCYIH